MYFAAKGANSHRHCSSICGVNRQPYPPQLDKINSGTIIVVEEVEEVSSRSGDFSCSFSEIVVVS